MSIAISEQKTISDAYTSTARVDMAGSETLLLDVSVGPFDMELQRRIWALSKTILQSIEHVREVVPGVNNLMVVFDPLTITYSELAAEVLALWAVAQPYSQQGRLFEIPVYYGGAAGEDLALLAQRADMTEEQFVEHHSQASYEVICLGAMPGYAYLAGLPPELSSPRRAVPRIKLPKGSVIIGGSQASILPADGPCGWHVIGTADLEMFDPHRTPNCLMSPGDRVRFIVMGFESSVPKKGEI
jgi:KipI family sensor histidine kinase inhibitor